VAAQRTSANQRNDRAPPYLPSLGLWRLQNGSARLYLTGRARLCVEAGGYSGHVVMTFLTGSARVTAIRETGSS
jgi:hypothetical protein